MHITISTSELQKVVEVVSKISTKHITLPILQCVVLESKEKKLIIRATNLEIGIEGSITVDESQEDGIVAVPSQTFLQTINLISQKNITLSTEGDVLHIETQTSKTDIKTMDVSDFPIIPRISGNTYTINATLFAMGIKTTAFAASQSSIKPELGSVYIFQKKEHSLTFVATDSFRLIEKTIPQKSLVLEESILVPFKNALELARVAELAHGDASLFIHENQCAIDIGNMYITSRLVSGTFPDYEQIIPKEYAAEAIILTQDLAQALKKTNIFLNKFMQLTLTLTDGAMILSSQNTDAGATTESIHATTQGGDIRLNFNQRYIGEIITHISDESMMFKFAGIGRPMVVHNVHDTSLRYLVMPMNK